MNLRMNLSRRGGLRLAALLWLPTLALPVSGQWQQPIQGRVTTRSGAEVEGVLRWTEGPAALGDLLRGRSAADVEWEDRVMESMGADLDVRGRSVEFLGVRISWDDDRGPAGSPETAVSVGHLAQLRSSPEGAVIAVLRSGEEIVFHDSFGPIEIDRGAATPVVVDADDMVRVDFSPVAPTPTRSARRTWGVVEDRWGGRWEGLVTWGRGQSVETDTLNGRDEGGVVHRLSFGSIREVRPIFAGGAAVLASDGREWVLSDAPDVDRGHAGIEVVDPQLGVVAIPWVDVRRVELIDAPSSVTAREFDGDRPLSGTVRTRGGGVLTGRLHWGTGADAGWEHLEGGWRGLDFAVELARVESIARATSGGGSVLLRDGRTLELRGRDFGTEARGVVVEDDEGTLRLVEWRRLVSVHFDAQGDHGGD